MSLHDVATGARTAALDVTGPARLAAHAAAGTVWVTIGDFPGEHISVVARDARQVYHSDWSPRMREYRWQLAQILELS